MNKIHFKNHKNIKKVANYKLKEQKKREERAKLKRKFVLSSLSSKKEENSNSSQDLCTQIPIVTNSIMQ